MSAFLFCVCAALLASDAPDYTPIDTRMCWGIAALDGCRFVTDCAAGELLSIGRDGRMSTSASGAPSAPRGLCAVGNWLAYADGASRTIAFVDPQRMAIVRSIPAPSPNPQGLAFDGQHLWCADDEMDCLYRIDPQSGETLGQVAAPSYTPRGVAFCGGKLWVVDSWDLCAYRVDPRTGATEASVWLPPGRPRALLADNESLLVTLADRNALVQVGYSEGASYTLSLPVAAHIKLSCIVRPRADEGAPAGARILVAVPPNTIRQSINRLEPFPDGFSHETDDFGQAVLSWDIPPLAGGQTFACGWGAGVRVWAIRHHPRPGILPRANTVTDSAYVRGDRYVTVEAPAVRALADGLVGLHTVSGLVSLRDRVCEHMSYRLDGRWDPADVCLERGTGSCSEYSCVFAGVARGMGIPVRFAGGTILRPPKDRANPSVERLDIHWHRWPELHLAGHGWLPVDSTRDDNSAGPPFRRRNFLAIAPGVFVCSRGPFGDGTALGRDYRRRLIPPEGQDRWRIEATALWRLRALTPWT